MKKKITKASDLRRAQYIKDILKKDAKDQKFCVLGAGHGGLAMAGHLAIKGFKVNLITVGESESVRIYIEKESRWKEKSRESERLSSLRPT